jgi:mono/diheme cytochrome c family protein
MKIKYLSIVCSLWFVVACGNSKNEGTADEAIDETSGDNLEPVDPIEAGKAIYLSNCKLCHGEDGTLGASGAANLQKSVLKTQDLNNVISYGKGNMTGYKGLIEPKDIENVVAYIETLRK